MQLTGVSPSMTRCVLASLKNQFKYCVAIAANQENIIVLASDSPLRPSWKTIRDSYDNNTAIQQDLRKQRINSPEAILARIVTTSANIDSIIRGAPLNSDDLNYLEYVIGETYENKTYFAANRSMFEKAIGVPSLDIDWRELSSPEKGEVMNHVAHEAMELKRPTLAYAWALNSAKEHPSEVSKRLIGQFQQGQSGPDSKDVRTSK